MCSGSPRRWLPVPFGMPRELHAVAVRIDQAAGLRAIVYANPVVVDVLHVQTVQMGMELVPVTHLDSKVSDSDVGPIIRIDDVKVQIEPTVGEHQQICVSWALGVDPGEAENLAVPLLRGLLVADREVGVVNTVGNAIGSHVSSLLGE